MASFHQAEDAMQAAGEEEKASTVLPNGEPYCGVLNDNGPIDS